MNRTVIILLSALWFTFGIAYYGLLTQNMTIAGPGKATSEKGDSTLEDNGSTVHFPLYFELDKSLPKKGEGFDEWLNELKSAIGSKDTLLITGLYYSGETNGEILATSRSLAVQRMLSKDIEPARLVVDFSDEVQAGGRGLYVKGIRTDIHKLEDLQRMTAEGIKIIFSKGKVKWAPGNATENKLAEVKDRVRDNYNYSIIVIAHTSASGVPDADYELGRKRAWVVKKFLMDTGLDPDRISTESKGAEQPEFDDARYEGNDRVIVEIRLNDVIE